MSVPLTAIVAMTGNRVIGRSGKMPWHMPTDMRHFKAATMTKPVIMGRTTWESIPNGLPGRHVIVVTRRNLDAPEGTRVAHSIDEAVDIAQTIAEQHSCSEIIVGGGGEIWRATLPILDRMIASHLHMNLDDGDTLFPEINPDLWREVSRRDGLGGPMDTTTFSLVLYERVAPQ